MGSGSTNRTGRVSSIDYERGTYEVTYFDRGQSVTRQINAMSNGEYKMPKIGQVVSVSHNSNGSAAATTTGTVWNASNRPAEGYKGLYRKEYSNTKGQAYERYDENTGVYTQFAPNRTGRNCNGEIYDEAKGAASIVAGGQVQINSRKASVSLQAAEGVGINAGKNVSIEAGTSMSLESAADTSISAGAKYSLEATGDAKEEFKAKLERKVTGTMKEEVTGAVTLNFPGGVTLTVGGTTIKISTGGDISISSGTQITMSAPKITIDGADGDATIKSVSLVHHKHAGGPEPDQ